MSLKKLLLSAAVFSIAFSLQAEAAEHAKKTREYGPYITARGGLDMLRYHGDKDTWFASGALGAYFEDMRAEVEYGYHGEVKKTHENEENKVHAQTYLFNLYYDIPMSEHFKPYVSAGAGMAHVRKTVPNDKTSKNKFAWAAGGGMAFEINHTLALDVGYRYMDMGSSVSSNEFYGGIRLSF